MDNFMQRKKSGEFSTENAGIWVLARQNSWKTMWKLWKKPVGSPCKDAFFEACPPHAATFSGIC
ncbi:MAG: hypothetical protein J6K73_11885 [Clostridia bacterium]|nr:hypothetical protein [Clostridia bacterium]MBP3650470.1 hypothetical protein [Clostridia bacterium]